ncbi:IS66 family insertion sequence element accessory protein TnpB [Lacticaseibacillus styriensis]|uniref:IS66 family insertion sequence element accessory protein TnpB n=1 Tax=Lacticaseibacillus TaxID=2759736 RepID=UPI000B4493D8|nr:transposase [Lacticaseibacillus casei]
MISNLSKANSYIVCARIDLRKGIDGLAAFVTEECNMNAAELCEMHDSFFFYNMMRGKNSGSFQGS